ncbi:GNAT family N-acetyltransferase [Schumannella soli]|uniref:GNAT family N-acetyltransferase n=2 Tax=Schumannella soli TaxID=2590779 RepID=A0A506Y0B2_9MICO|nr:GNAT family N-acetyltransferase [Schumannella soli]
MRSELASPHTFYLVAERDGAREVAGPPAVAGAGRSGGAGPVGAEVVGTVPPLPPSGSASASASHIVGYAGLSAPSSAEQGDVQNIAVVAELRGAGLGRHLLRRLVAEAERRGLSDVLLEVRIDNSVAQSLYAAEGFEQIAIRPRYYRGAIDAVIMRKQLAVDPTEEASP